MSLPAEDPGKSGSLLRPRARGRSKEEFYIGQMTKDSSLSPQEKRQRELRESHRADVLLSMVSNKYPDDLPWLFADLPSRGTSSRPLLELSEKQRKQRARSLTWQRELERRPIWSPPPHKPPLASKNDESRGGDSQQAVPSAKPRRVYGAAPPLFAERALPLGGRRGGEGREGRLSRSLGGGPWGDFTRGNIGAPYTLGQVAAEIDAYIQGKAPLDPRAAKGVLGDDDLGVSGLRRRSPKSESPASSASRLDVPGGLKGALW